MEERLRSFLFYIWKGGDGIRSWRIIFFNTQTRKVRFLRFRISGFFEREGFEIEVPVETVEATTGDVVNQYARNANLGSVFFDPAHVRLCYLKRGGRMRELQGKDCRCTVLRQPEEHGRHISPRVYSAEDFQRTPFSNFLTLLSREMPTDRNAYFEYIAYAFSPCDSVAFSQDTDEKKGGICHAVH